MSSQSITIKQGDTTDTFQVSPFPVGQSTPTLVTEAGWTCRSIVMSKIGGVEVINNTITTLSADDLYFETALASPDTDILAAKAYIWIIELQNLTLTPVYRREHHIALAVEAQGAQAATDIQRQYNIVRIGTLVNSQKNKDVVVIPLSTSVAAEIGAESHVKVLLKNAAGDIMQTTGFISDTDSVSNPGVDREITLIEPVSGSPTVLTLITKT